MPLDHNLNSLVGRTFGYLKVLRPSSGQFNKTARIVYWDCRCVCGDIIHVRGTELRKGKRKSCGCIYRKMRKQIMETSLYRNGQHFTSSVMATRIGSYTSKVTPHLNSMVNEQLLTRRHISSKAGYTYQRTFKSRLVNAPWRKISNAELGVDPNPWAR